MKITQTAGELLEKRKTMLIPNYSFSFSGHPPKGGCTAGLQLEKTKYMNLHKSKKN